MIEFGGRPAYHQIADDLRRHISDGTLAPGDKLPSESTLSAQYKVSRVVARMAIAQLRNDGLIISHTGKGSFVRNRPPQRRIASDRYQREVEQIPRNNQTIEPQTSFTHDQQIPWNQYRLDKKFTEVQANAQLAELFETEINEPLLKRQFIFYANELPQQMSTSYLLMKTVRDTPIADPANEPWPGGNIAQLATLGKIINRVEESVQARMPTPEETSTLAITPGIPVLTITRRMLADNEILEVAADIIIPADRTILDYSITLNPPQ
jgi:GntR family transcriptional regulator